MSERTYPSKDERKPNKKQQKRLESRIRNWESTGSAEDAKNRVGYNGFLYRKPGSNKK